jgi:methionyl-tRNA formyltransferase
MTLAAVFFGTPEFAVPSLEALLDAGVSVPLVVTQPDRPVGRHAEVRPSPIAAVAARHGLAVEKPDRIRDNAPLRERLRAARPDAIAVVAYGRLLPADLLELPRLSCVNVHASLLPRHRGASPVQAVILAGDRETGVVTMRMEPELDAGPIYLENRTAIGERETAGELSARLAAMGGRLLAETLRRLDAGGLVPRPQEGTPTFSRPIRREDGAVDWSRPAGELLRRLRAFTPWPGLYSFFEGDRVKILEAREAAGGSSAPPGEVRREAGDLVASAGGGSTLVLERLQRSGRKPVSGAEFARSSRLPGRFRDAP